MISYKNWRSRKEMSQLKSFIRQSPAYGLKSPSKMYIIGIENVGVSVAVKGSDCGPENKVISGGKGEAEPKRANTKAVNRIRDPRE
jgi:hypothetical protein